MRSFTQSEQYLLRAERSIPLGSQTFSKSKTQYPYGVSPYFITHASGSRVWDLDGNEYIDFINSLASVTLGYSDPDVTDAVKRQLEKGVIFSLPSPIEAEVAELICNMVPCAEMVRFGKNGSDATAGAVRLARAYTGRDRIALCGYHGWQDWYIGTTNRSRGVPEAVQALSHAFPFNDLEALKRVLDAHPGEFAAVILEPMNSVAPAPGFLYGVKDLAHRNSVLVIFDETITGFRFARGGAQEHFGVTPDLACFGKGLANGYPISAIAGRRDVMKLMEEIFFSFTFGGEALSLAAAKATLKKLQTEPVVETLAASGSVISQRLAQIIADHRLAGTLSITGHPSWTFLNIKDGKEVSGAEVKTFLMQELHQRGVLCLGTHNLSYAHTEDDVRLLVDAYEHIIASAAHHIRAGTLRAALRCKPLIPLFKVR